MPIGPGRGEAAGAPPAPEPDLLAASAMVFVPDPAAPVLSGDDAHHLLDVLRLRSGELVIAGDGAGSWAPCRVRAGSGSRGSRGVDPTSALTVEGPVVFTPRPAPEITVAFAPAKGDRPEWVTQKLTEVGVDRIVPLRAARSVVRWEGDRGRRAVVRLNRVAREAAAQCRRPWLPEVNEVTSLGGLALMAGGPPELAQPGGSHVSLARPVVAVGPEGGWDADELDRFGAGVGLGPTVLRAETAAVTVGTLLCALRSGAVRSLA
jgi:16S rRNA (uracil1498-N3)-methyltransferase